MQNQLQDGKRSFEKEKCTYGYDFTHDTSVLASSKTRSAYATLTSVPAKLDLQIRNAEIINAVDPNKTVSNIVSTHLVPDMIWETSDHITARSFR